MRFSHYHVHLLFQCASSRRRHVCILSGVMMQVGPERRNLEVSSLVVQHNVSEIVWPLGAE